eukprot:7595751-Alexandrium_andersonii.AAC.1
MARSSASPSNLRQSSRAAAMWLSGWPSDAATTRPPRLAPLEGSRGPPISFAKATRRSPARCAPGAALCAGR